MQHPDHVNLLRPANLAPGGTWADLGAGSGAFTLALRELIGSQAQIYAVDKDRGSLRSLESEYKSRFGGKDNLHILRADFSGKFDIPPLDGVLMANSLHFFRDKHPVLEAVRSMLTPGGVFLLVEYNVDSGNMWVPHPLSFERWKVVATEAGFTEPRLLARHPSNFLREFYSAMCHRPPA